MIVFYLMRVQHTAEKLAKLEKSAFCSRQNRTSLGQIIEDNDHNLVQPAL